jgi:hypothetical protein
MCQATSLLDLSTRVKGIFRQSSLITGSRQQICPDQFIQTNLATNDGVGATHPLRQMRQ